MAPAEGRAGDPEPVRSGDPRRHRGRYRGGRARERRRSRAGRPARRVRWPRRGAELAIQSLFGLATLADIADGIVEAELASVGEAELGALLAEYDGLDEEELRAPLAEGDTEGEAGRAAAPTGSR